MSRDEKQEAKCRCAEIGAGIAGLIAGAAATAGVLSMDQFKDWRTWVVVVVVLAGGLLGGAGGWFGGRALACFGD